MEVHNPSAHQGFLFRGMLGSPHACQRVHSKVRNNKCGPVYLPGYVLSSLVAGSTLQEHVTLTAKTCCIRLRDPDTRPGWPSGGVVGCGHLRECQHPAVVCTHMSHVPSFFLTVQSAGCVCELPHLCATLWAGGRGPRWCGLRGPTAWRMAVGGTHSTSANIAVCSCIPRSSLAKCKG